jgi:hypothetical protein
MSIRGWNAAGFAGLLAVGLLAAGGAAALPSGLQLGLPRALPAAAVVGGLALLWWCGAREARPWAALFLIPAWLAVAGERGLALSGPPLWSLFLAGVIALLAGARLRPPDWLFLPALLVVYGAAAGNVQRAVGPEGDEPHYLMVADSLLRDHDVDVTRDYAEGRYRTFHPRPLEPHFRVRGRDGQIYSVHALGLSLLILPAYAAAGYAGASYFMALLAVALALEIRRLLATFAIPPALASGVAWAIALCPPLVHYAGLIFTEVPAALLLAFGLRKARGADRLTVRAALAWGAALGCLAWLNVRYAAFPVVLVLYALSRGLKRRQLFAALAPLVASAAAVSLYHFALYGFFDPRRVYGRAPEFSVATLVEGIPGLFLDQEFGLFVYAPLFVLALKGASGLWRESRHDALVLGSLVLLVVLTAGSWDMWRGGFNPPARFLVPLLPALALGVAWGLRRGLTAPAAMLLGWSLWAGLSGAASPELIHRDRDGTAPFFRVHSGGLEWTRLLPGFVLAESERWRLALVWSLALGLAAGARRAPAGLGSVALSTGGLLAATLAASQLSHARTEGRDAVRLLGRTAIEWPRLRATASATARWGPSALAWGPLFEPHRYPDGATLGSRLVLPAGSYRLRLMATDSVPLGAAPRLLVHGEDRDSALVAVPFESAEPRGWTAAFTVGALEEHGLRLAVTGGSAFVLQEVEIAVGAANPDLAGAAEDVSRYTSRANGGQAQESS